MPRIVRIAAVQPALELLCPQENVARVGEMLAGTSAPVDLIVLPEIVNGWPCPREGASAHTDLTLAALAELARRRDAVVVGGSVAVSEDGRVRNVCFVFDRGGAVVGRYAKRVPFGRERPVVQAGEGDGLFEVDGLRIGVLICGDLWRPTLAAACAGGVDVLCVPARSGVPRETHGRYGRALWTSLALTRGMENALAVAVADWAAGEHAIDGAAHWTCGGASIVNPGARPDMQRLQAGLENGAAGVIRVDIDLAELAAFRDYRRSVGLLSP